MMKLTAYFFNKKIAIMHIKITAIIKNLVLMKLYTSQKRIEHI